MRSRKKRCPWAAFCPPTGSVGATWKAPTLNGGGRREGRGGGDAGADAEERCAKRGRPKESPRGAQSDWGRGRSPKTQAPDRIKKPPARATAVPPKGGLPPCRALGGRGDPKARARGRTKGDCRPCSGFRRY